jgi:hypothetical protein
MIGKLKRLFEKVQSEKVTLMIDGVSLYEENADEFRTDGEHETKLTFGSYEHKQSESCNGEAFGDDNGGFDPVVFEVVR